MTVGINLPYLPDCPRCGSTLFTDFDVSTRYCTVSCRGCGVESESFVSPGEAAQDFLERISRYQLAVEESIARFPPVTRRIGMSPKSYIEIRGDKHCSPFCPRLKDSGLPQYRQCGMYNKALVWDARADLAERCDPCLLLTEKPGQGGPKIKQLETCKRCGLRTYVNAVNMCPACAKETLAEARTIINSTSMLNPGAVSAVASLRRQTVRKPKPQPPPTLSKEAEEDSGPDTSRFDLIILPEPEKPT